MNKNKKTIIVVGALLCVCIIGIIIYFVTRPKVYAGDEIVTESNGKYYEDTTDVLQDLDITPLNYLETSIGDDIVISKESGAFSFEGHGLETDKVLYVFIDGDIDNIAGSYTVHNNILNDKVILKDSFNGVGDHIAQFVQFDGPDVIFCKTKHYTVVINPKNGG